jgi:hypothetical protein
MRLWASLETAGVCWHTHEVLVHSLVYTHTHELLAYTHTHTHTHEVVGLLRDRWGNLLCTCVYDYVYT